MNEKLRQLYEEDILDRNNIHSEELYSRDQARRKETERVLGELTDLAAEDFHHAALIFQHGETLEHYKKAHELAMKAVSMGDDSARWLAAAALDRSLVMSGQPQKYGTQFKLNEENRWEMILPVDASTTDEERARWHVPPLGEAKKVFYEKYGL